ncbi:MAG: MaoC family dehydratase [Limnochordales bacterium]|nr:MaoC family dehydratase [Limnochordales bacterium]
MQHISGRRARAFRLQELTIGQRAAITRKVTAREVLLYMGATGDLNPIYLDRNYAARTPLGEPVVPAVLLAGYVFALLTQRLPGPGTVSLSQSLLFLHPVRIGDTVTVTAEVTAIDKARGRVRLRLVARNQRGQEVLSGDAEVLPPHDLRPVLSEAFEDYD